MRISEATIRSIVRRKLLEAVTVGREVGAEVDQNLTISIPLKSTKEEVKDFLDSLENGSTIYVNSELIRTKRNNNFEGVGLDGKPISSANSSSLSLSNKMFSGDFKLDDVEVYDSKGEKVAVGGFTAAMVDDAIAGRSAAGSVISPEKSALLKWQKEVTARPLQLGSKGPNVGILQDLLINALNAIPSSFTLGPEGAAVRAQFNQLVKPGKDGTRPSAPGAKNKGDPRISLSQDADYNTLSNIAGALAFSLSRDNDFGPVTRVSVYLFQQFENQQSGNLQPDGRVGKYTAAALMKYAKSS